MSLKIDLKNISIEELKNKLLHFQEVKEKTQAAPNIKLDSRLIDFFLEKVDNNKLISRIIKDYNLVGDEVDIFFKDNFQLEYNNIHSILSQSIFVDKLRKNDVLNNLLAIDEKKQLADLYLSKKISILEQNIKSKEKSIKKAEQSEIIKQQIEESKKEHLLKTYTDLIVISLPSENKALSKKSAKKIRTRIKAIESFISLEVGSLSTDQIKNLKYSLEILGRTLKEKLSEKNKDKKVKSNIVMESEKTKAYHRKIEQFKKQQEEELLRKIENRKKGILEEDTKTISKIEPIVIEAYLEDFNSARSRFVLSVLTANNITLSFYNGLIKLLNEDDSFEEIYFYTVGNILKFSSEKYLKDVSIDISSTEIISNILSKQEIEKEYSYLILDCLSVIYYINTFYKESEKVEVSMQEIENIKVNPTKNKNVDNQKSIVYLTKNKKSVRTMKIKKGIRKIEGAFLIRGHWRRQNYANGVVKLIRIEPFWKGIGDKKSRLYKIPKQ